MTKKILTEAELQQVKEHIARAEKKTSGEIVPFIAEASDSYRWVTLLWVLIGWFLVSVKIFILTFFFPWHFSILQVLFFEILGMFVGLGLSTIPALRRLTIPQIAKDFHVHRECLATFLEQGLTETRHRTGVLIYFSLLERKIEILADKGLYTKTTPDFWKAQVDKIVKGIHQGKLVDQLCQVIDAIGDELAKNYPPEKDDTNELSDDVRFKDDDPTRRK